MEFMTASPIADEDYSFIRKLVYDWSGINLGPNKKELVRNRLQKRLQALGLKNFDAYCRFLDEEECDNEKTALLDAISTNVTHFFREWKHFEFLQESALPQWENRFQRKPGEPLRVWSAACSSGEEPYSLAIILAEFFRCQPQFQPPAWKIFATDISSRVLSTARDAIYKSNRIKLPEPSWLHSYFQKGSGSWDGYCRVKSELRESVEFHHLNLAQWPYPFSTKFDAIFCRNVMIYFDSQTQQQLISHLMQHLAPKGFLFIGHSEKLLSIEHGLKHLRPSIYQLG